MGKKNRRAWHRLRRDRTPENPNLRFHADYGSTLWHLRDEAHRAFDVHWEFYDTWQERTWARKRAYQWLAHNLGIPVEHCHFGMFGEHQCRAAIELCRASTPTGYPVRAA